MELLSGEVVVERPKTQHRVEQSVLEEALKKVSSGNRDFFIEQVEFGRIIGQATRVHHESGISRIYAKIEGRKNGYFPFIQDKAQDATSIVVIVKKAREDNNYILIDAWIGAQATPMPWDQNAKTDSMHFWSQNALILGSEQIIPGSELEIPPVSEEYNDILEAALKLAEKYQPNASSQHNAAYANSVASAVTGWSGGYGGPSIREHLAGRVAGVEKYSFDYAAAMLLASDGPIFGPINNRHRQLFACEHCFSDDPADLKELRG